MSQPVYIIDMETDGLRKQATRIHCLVARTPQGDVYEFIGETAVAGFFREANAMGAVLVGHNILGFDLPVLARFCGPTNYDHRLNQSVIDTLVLSRLLNYKIKGGHSLEAWGERLGVPKQGKDITDWSCFTPLMLERCRSDTEINTKLYLKFKRFLDDPAWKESIWLEHFVARVCLEMEDTGVPFDVQGAESLRQELLDLIQPIDEIILRDFKPKAIPIREITPRLTKDGSFNRNDFRWWGSEDLTMFTGGPFTRFEYQTFNPGSHKQVIERLNEAGWKPVEKTDGHIEATREGRVTDIHRTYGWKISEKNLATLPETAPEGARSLAKRIVLQSRLSDLEEWMALVSKDGRIHPTFTSIGAWTHRLSHSNPNSANIPSYKPSDHDTDFQRMVQDINARMRRLFIAPKGKRLIGTDADGIQMRIFAHVIQDEKLVEALISGRKEDSSDIHSVHKRALGDTAGSRDEAKTFIYAFLLGAGVGKVSEIFGSSTKEAKAAVSRFLEFYPGLKRLKETLIPQWASRGWFEGLDGRKVICDSEHLMLAGILQNGEKVIMAMALREWLGRLEKEGISFELVNWVHDEWQTLVDDDDDIVARVQQIQIESFRSVGEKLNLFCPLDGSSDAGYNWMETH